MPRHTALADRLFHTPGQWNLQRCLTADCGTLWLDPAPTTEDLLAAYVGYYTSSQSRPRRTIVTKWLKQADQLLRRAYLSKFYGYPFEGSRALWLASLLLPWRSRYYGPSVMRLPHRAGGTLLDVGAGNGSFMASMRELGWNVEGVEVDPGAREAARALHGVTVRAGGIQQQGFRDQSFDAVVLRHVLEHVNGPIELLRECYRVLKPGGRLAIVTPNADSLGARVFGAHWRGLEPPRHLQVFTVQSLERAARAAGFESASVSSTATDPYMLIASYALVRNKPFREAVPLVTRFERLSMEVLLTLECAILLWNPRLGEEVVLSCERAT